MKISHQKSLEKNEALFRTVFQLAPDGMSISRLDNGLFIDVNQGFCKMLGYERTDVIGQTSYALHFWHDFKDRQMIVEKLTQSGKLDNFETTIINRFDRKVNVMLSARTIDIDAEKCLLLSYKDVTTQAQALDALRQSEQQFKNIFDTSPDSILITDSRGLIYDINAVFEAVSGYTRQEVIGRTTADVGLWQSLAQRERFVAELQRCGKVQNMEIVALTKSGEEKVFYLSAKLMTLEGSERILSIVRDVTDIKTAEQALYDSERKHRELSLELQAILDGIPDALVLWSHDRRVLWANRGSWKYLLSAPDQVIGKTCMELCHSGHDHEKCSINTCFLQAENSETHERTHDNRTWSVKSFPITNETGAVVKVLTIATDITERLRLRDEANRSARLAAVGELAAGVAHEINNPNGLILMNMALVHDVVADLLPILQDQCIDAEHVRLGGLPYRKALGTLTETIVEVIESGHRIRQIVDELKDFSRPYDHKGFMPVDMNAVVQKALKMLRISIDKVTDNFAVNYAESDAMVFGDQRQLEQVVVNLVMNACQALRARSECLVVGVFHDASHSQVYLRVWDEGVGIAANVLSQITDPFFTTRREVGGTGLGLSVSARIIEEHNGHLEFSSVPDYGTTVTVRLPVAGAIE